MSRHDLSEIDLTEGEQRIRLRRGPRVVAGPVGPALLPPTPPSGPSALTPVEKPAAADASKPPRKLIEIKSPTVGTFYAQKEPGAPPFVTVGSRVTPTTIVCIIE